MDNLFNVAGLKKWYSHRHETLWDRVFKEKQHLKAIDGVDFEINEGEIVGLAGQSGCGKSTLGEIMVGLQKPTEGRIEFKGDELAEFTATDMKNFRQECQIIFQDPYESVNPRLTVAQWVAEPLVIHKIGDGEERDARVKEALADAGLSPPEKFIDKVPSELSGGERQRVSIARAMVLDPIFVVADEPVSMLDVSVKTKILKLFKKLQEEKNFTMLYISHDLSTIRYMSDRVMIMYLGKIVELGPTDGVIQNPAHPYSEKLISSIPTTDPTVKRRGSDIKGDVPDPVDLPNGCRFHPRCEYATEECKDVEPELEAFPEMREVACYHPVSDE